MLFWSSFLDRFYRLMEKKGRKLIFHVIHGGWLLEYRNSYVLPNRRPGRTEDSSAPQITLGKLFAIDRHWYNSLPLPYQAV